MKSDHSRQFRNICFHMRFQDQPKCGLATRTTQVSGEKWDNWEVKGKSGIIFRMIRLKTTFTDVTADTLYDVLHDPVYRKVEDTEIELDPLLTLCRAGTSTWSAPGSSARSTQTMTCLTTPSTVPHLSRTGTLSFRDPGYKHHRRSETLRFYPLNKTSINRKVICFSITSSTTVSFTKSILHSEGSWGDCPTWQASSWLPWEARAATSATWLTPTQVRGQWEGNW